MTCQRSTVWLTADNLDLRCDNLRRPREQLLGRLDGGWWGRRAPKHGRQLLDALVAGQRRDVGARAAALDALEDAQVLGAERSHLWEVGDAQHLVCLTEQAQLLAHDVAAAATHTCVHLIQD